MSSTSLVASSAVLDGDMPASSSPPSTTLDQAPSTQSPPGAAQTTRLGNPGLFGHNAFVASWNRPPSSGHAATQRGSKSTRPRTTVEHKSSLEAALKDAAEANVGEYHSRDSSHQLQDASRFLVFPPVDAHCFFEEFSAARAAGYGVSVETPGFVRSASFGSFSDSIYSS